MGSFRIWGFCYLSSVTEGFGCSVLILFLVLVVESMQFCLLTSRTVVHVNGTDAVAVINNLCTNDVQRLEVGQFCEAFVTNLKGWAVGHVFVTRTEVGVDLIGLGDFAEPLVEHIDRYIIREDAELVIDNEAVAAFVAGVGREALLERLGEGAQVIPGFCNGCLVVAGSEPSQLIAKFEDAESLEPGEFERIRVASFLPLIGKEVREKSIPQELDRDEQAISFTKGCYLGQETIARLDARGQLQKKLCKVELPCDWLNSSNDDMAVHDASGKVIGELTSFAECNSTVLALGYLKRGNNEPGAEVVARGKAGEVVESRMAASSSQ